MRTALAVLASSFVTIVFFEIHLRAMLGRARRPFLPLFTGLLFILLGAFGMILVVAEATQRWSPATPPLAWVAAWAGLVFSYAGLQRGRLLEAFREIPL